MGVPFTDRRMDGLAKAVAGRWGLCLRRLVTLGF
jgi:hypothetical protein